VTPWELQRLAEDRLLEAEALLAAGRWSAARVQRWRQCATDALAETDSERSSGSVKDWNEGGPLCRRLTTEREEFALSADVRNGILVW
jgi:hypothetical protein